MTLVWTIPMSDELHPPPRPALTRPRFWWNGLIFVALVVLAFWAGAGPLHRAFEGTMPTATPGAEASRSAMFAARPAANGPPPATPDSPGKDASVDEPLAPSFDIVRVAPNGEAVLAGRAAPNSEVRIKAGDAEIGRATADSHGSWVVVPSHPIAPGGQQLALTSTGRDGRTVEGAAPVVVIVPQLPEAQTTGHAGDDRQAANAAASTGAPAGWTKVPLVVETPLDGPSRVLQTPLAPAAVPAPASGGGEIRSGQLGLNAIDYDEHGEIRFAGTAAKGARVLAYVDNRPVGEAVTDQAGRWIMVPQNKLAVGEHRVRIDQVVGLSGRAGVPGKVTARIELPFQRAAVAAKDVAEGRVVVQPKETLWYIARRAYGQGVRYTVIYEANQDQIRDPNRIYPGQVFAIPPTGVIQAGKPTGIVEGAAKPSSSTTSR